MSCLDVERGSIARSLVVASNRLPYRFSDGHPGKLTRNVGGLVNALEPALEERGGTWIGWDGESLRSRDEVKAGMCRVRSYRLPSGITLHGVPLTEREVALYYHGLCNRALWPLFHDFPGRAVYRPEEWDSYVRVNRRFAEIVLRSARPGDRVWIHDYQLMLVPGFLRELGFGGRIDFFLHTPFPPPEIFRALPWRDEIERGLLGADAVVFHIERYRANFAAAARVDGRSIERGTDGDGAAGSGRRATWTAALPIGADVVDFERLAHDPTVRARAARLRAAFGGGQLIFGAERLDYTKGILERFRAFERFLQLNRGAMGRTALVQAVVPSRHQVDEYRQFKREIDREVGRINGELAADGWQPIHYRYRVLDRRELVAHYLAADVALVTPLRDGMNLVAAEFVASRVDETGVLVLSEFAGIADCLPRAVLVNPNDVERFAASIGAALEMPDRERRERMRSMRRVVTGNPAAIWASRCLDVGSGTHPALERIVTPQRALA